jgi:hypothetical protein
LKIEKLLLKKIKIVAENYKENLNTLFVKIIMKKSDYENLKCDCK